MRFKTGIVVGFAAGYYFGAKAGRERFHQIQDLLDHAKDNAAVQKAVDQAKQVVTDTREKALDVIESHTVGATGTPIDADTTETNPFPDSTDY